MFHSPTPNPGICFCSPNRETQKTTLIYDDSHFEKGQVCWTVNEHGIRPVIYLEPGDKSFRVLDTRMDARIDNSNPVSVYCLFASRDNADRFFLSKAVDGQIELTEHYMGYVTKHKEILSAFSSVLELWSKGN